MECVRFYGSNDQPQITVFHGSTVAANVLLEHNGAATEMVMTCGHRGFLQIYRQNHPALYIFLPTRYHRWSCPSCGSKWMNASTIRENSRGAGSI